MNSFIMHVSHQCEWQPTLWISSMKGSESEAGQATIELGQEWISALRYDDVIHDYDDIELIALESMIQGYQSYLIEWKGAELVQRLIHAIPEGSQIIIDNDHGVICPVDWIKLLPLESWVRASHINRPD